MSNIYDHPGLFDKLVNIVLANEGWDQFTNRVNDKGGATKFGISDMRDGIRDGMTDTDGDGKPDTEIKDLTLEQAKQIYKTEYYEPLNPHYIKDEELILNLFDFGVTSGPKTAVKLLQIVLCSPQDGALGPITAGKANNYCNVIDVYKDARKDFYRNIVLLHPDQKDNLNGWLKRVDHLKLT